MPIQSTQKHCELAELLVSFSVELHKLQKETVHPKTKHSHYLLLLHCCVCIIKTSSRHGALPHFSIYKIGIFGWYWLTNNAIFLSFSVDMPHFQGSIQ